MQKKAKLVEFFTPTLTSLSSPSCPPSSPSSSLLLFLVKAPCLLHQKLQPFHPWQHHLVLQNCLKTWSSIDAPMLILLKMKFKILHLQKFLKLLSQNVAHYMYQFVGFVAFFCEGFRSSQVR